MLTAEGDLDALSEFTLGDLLNTMLLGMENDPGVTCNKSLKETFIPKTTALLIAAIYFIGILVNFPENFNFILVTKLRQDPNINIEIRHIIQVLNILKNK